VLYFVSVLCLVCRILSVPLDCHFFNVPSFMFSVCAFLFALFYVLSFFFVACLVCPILSVSLDCHFFNVPSFMFSVCAFLFALFYVLSFFSSLVLCAQYCLCLWNVHSLVFLKTYVFCVVLCCCWFCCKCCQCLWIVHSWMSLLFYLTVIYQDVCKNKSVNSIIKSKRITIWNVRFNVS
jgi:hypothetical protein